MAKNYTLERIGMMDNARLQTKLIKDRVESQISAIQRFLDDAIRAASRMAHELTNSSSLIKSEINRMTKYAVDGIIQIYKEVNIEMEKTIKESRKLNDTIIECMKQVIDYGEDDFKNGMKRIGEMGATALANGYWGKIKKWRVWDIETLNALFGMSYIGSMIQETQTTQIPRFHQGGQIPGEGWFLGLEGEGVLNRQAMGRLGDEGLAALNQGANMGGGVTQISIKIYAWDGDDVEETIRKKIIPQLRELSEAGEVVVHENGVKHAVA